jgi:ubiquinone/menaquinone biosynthesis C-methylase UbiE
MAEEKSFRGEVQAHYQGIASEYNRRANRTCESTYGRLVRRCLHGKQRVLELGGGSSALLDSLGSPSAVACDLSREMLLMRPGQDRSFRVVAAGERLPFKDAEFEGVYSINMLEHVEDLESVLYESSRVLEEGGTWFAVTPNGNWEKPLDLAERWSLKIPEGPHRFLKTRELRESVERHFEVEEHRTLLMLPAGPPVLASWVDRISFCSAWGWGFFQYIAARKRSHARTS